jgi:hypothetical protein
MKTKLIICLLFCLALASCKKKEPVQTIEVVEYKVENGQ